jgi:hypothetical protein
MGKSMIIRQRLITLALSSPIFYIFKTREQYETTEIHRGILCVLCGYF